jgi:hypothetical protein
MSVGAIVLASSPATTGAQAAQEEGEGEDACGSRAA